MVLNPRVEPWTLVSDAEHRGNKPIFSSAEEELEGGLNFSLRFLYVMERIPKRLLFKGRSDT